MLTAPLQQECFVGLVPSCLGQLHMRYPDLLQRQKSFRSPSRRLATSFQSSMLLIPCKVLHARGRKVISSLLDSKGRVSRVHCFLSDLHPWWLLVHILANFRGTATQGLNYTGFQKSSDPELWGLRLDQQVKLVKQNKFYLNVNLQEEVNYLLVVAVPKILLTQLFHESILKYSNPQRFLHFLNSKNYIQYLLPTKHFIIYPPVLLFLILIPQVDF